MRLPFALELWSDLKGFAEDLESTLEGEIGGKKNLENSEKRVAQTVDSFGLTFPDEAEIELRVRSPWSRAKKTARRSVVRCIHPISPGLANYQPICLYTRAPTAENSGSGKEETTRRTTCDQALCAEVALLSFLRDRSHILEYVRFDCCAPQRSLNVIRPAFEQSVLPRSNHRRLSFFASSIDFQNNKCVPPIFWNLLSEQPYLYTSVFLYRMVRMAETGFPSLAATRIFSASPNNSIRF
jgi:hypothetical protein